MREKNEVKTATETAVAAPHSGPIEGLEGMRQQDLLISTYTIIQPTSRGDKGKLPAGHFYDSLSGGAMDVVQCVVLRMTPCRTLWQQGTPTPACSSYDGIRGNVHGVCASCSFNHWSKDRNEQTCNGGYLLVGANMDDKDNIFLFRAMGMSVKPIRGLYTEINNIGRNTGRPAFGHHVKLESKYGENDLGKFYFVSPMIVQPLTPEQIAHYRELYIMLGGANITEAEATPTSTTADDF